MTRSLDILRRGQDQLTGIGSRLLGRKHDFILALFAVERKSCILSWVIDRTS